MRMIGPNCMGMLNADPAVLLNATFSPVFPPAGRVAFTTQSGALGLAILEYARRVNLGLSTFASIGNKADVSSNDLIQYWADDPKTDVILLYLESFGNPRKFGQLAREVGRRKPIVAVKAGRSAPVRGRPPRTRARWPPATRWSTRCSDMPASFARRPSKRCSTSRCCSIGNRCRPAAASPSSPMPAAPAFSPPTRAKAIGLQVTPLQESTVDRTARVPAGRGWIQQPGRHARDGLRGRLRAARCALLLADAERRQPCSPSSFRRW